MFTFFCLFWNFFNNDLIKCYIKIPHKNHFVKSDIFVEDLNQAFTRKIQQEMIEALNTNRNKKNSHSLEIFLSLIFALHCEHLSV